MKTILFIWEYAPDPHRGGVERVTAALMDGFRERGRRAEFLLSGDILRMDDGVFLQYLSDKGIGIIINQCFWNGSLSRKIARIPWKGKYIICMHVNPASITRTHDFGPFIHKLFHVPHPFRKRMELFFKLAVFPCWRTRKRRKELCNWKAIYDACDDYVVLSRHFIEETRQLFNLADQGKIRVVNNPLSYPCFMTPEEAEAKRHEILIVARLCEEKCLHLALKSWKIIRETAPSDWRLTIVGDGPDAGKLRRLAQQYRLDNLSFEGLQDPLPYYKRASLFMMTSKSEGWPMTLMEAQQFGVVPVAMDSYASLHEIIEDGRNGCIVGNGDFRGMAQVLLRLMADREERMRLAEAGIRSARRFALEKILSDWEHLFDDGFSSIRRFGDETCSLRPHPWA